MWQFIIVEVVKFVYSEKATKFCKTSTLLLFTINTVMEILQVFVAFSEYINFKRQDSNTKQFLEVSLKDSRMKNFYPLPKSKICCDSIEKALKVLLEVLISWISLPRFWIISHLIWQLLSKRQSKWEIVSKFCGLFKMSEL